ncbi:MAG: hypothetical protein WCU00_09870 [Candidatus Latescibacterota bacterium]
MSIEERVEKLELKLAHSRLTNRLLAVFCVGTCILIWFCSSGAPTAQQSVLDEIRAKKFILEDENGKRLAMLGMSSTEPALILYDKKGMNRAVLTMVDDEPGLCLFDKNGWRRAALDIFLDEPGLHLSDENGKSRASLNILKIGPRLSLIDENDKYRAILGVSVTESKDGKKTTYPESSLLLFGTDGPMIWHAP